MNETKQLFGKLKKDHFPKRTMQLPEKQVRGIAFFPVGSGTFDCKGNISSKEIMILGQDFDTISNMKIVIENDQENIEVNNTWKYLLNFLANVEIDKNNCFFTNAFPGARDATKSIGASPGFENGLENSKNFFKAQVVIQKPKLILVLGLQVAKFLSKFVEGNKWDSITRFKDVDDLNNQLVTLKFDGFETKAILLLHPCLRKSNIRFRSYNGNTGNKDCDVEIDMMNDFLNEIKLEK